MIYRSRYTTFIELTDSSPIYDTNDADLSNETNLVVRKVKYIIQSIIVLVISSTLIML